MAGHRLRNLFTALAAAVCLATGAVGQTSNSSGTALYNPATPGYSSILVYDALVSVYNAYKYGAPFSALQLPYPDSLFYIVCQTLATTPGDNVVALHPTFPIGKTINQAVAAGFPLAINQATAVNAAASQFLGTGSYLRLRSLMDHLVEATLHLSPRPLQGSLSMAASTILERSSHAVVAPWRLLFDHRQYLQRLKSLHMELAHGVS
ncbi:hypothetical protein WJX84_008533 [Apatococcus fuscideae]|uniref:Uncharacterized protein n=1 Tax=Apatococcus fuscideae TaxID=2026836 RepID=A0AAW1SJ44_9CHLO